MFRLRARLRWFLRRRLRRLVHRPPVSPERWRSVLFLFAGTHGDAVQILRPLHLLSAAAPQAKIYLQAPAPVFAAFRAFWPEMVERVGYLGAWRRRAADLLCTNAVGVYRVRFDLLAACGGSLALGFRHVGEARRPAYSATLPLTPAVRNFESANLALLRLAGLRIAAESPPPPSPEGETVLLHVGSVGFRRRVGEEGYRLLLQGILEVLGNSVRIIAYGPGDEEVVESLKRSPNSTAAEFRHDPLPALAQQVRAHPGRIVCVDSFFAHFCRYLGRAAWVFHIEGVPDGYDCDPPHRQIVLPAAVFAKPAALRAILREVLWPAVVPGIPK